MGSIPESGTPGGAAAADRRRDAAPDRHSRRAAPSIRAARRCSTAAGRSARTCCRPVPPAPPAGCTATADAAIAPIVAARDIVLEATGCRRDFDVSRPWLQRLLAREPRRTLRAVDEVTLPHSARHHTVAGGRKRLRQVHRGAAGVGLYPPSDGRNPLRGQAAQRPRARSADMRRRMNMIFQDPYASLNPRWRVRDIVAEPIRAFRLLSGDGDDHAPGRRTADPGRAGAGRRREIPARVQRRPAPAHLDRAGACRASRNSWSATSRPARSTSRCRRRSST